MPTSVTALEKEMSVMKADKKIMAELLCQADHASQKAKCAHEAMAFVRGARESFRGV